MPSPTEFYPHWSQTPIPFRHTWSGIGNIDQFRWLSRADTHAQLKMARDELGLRHVRACAMYSPGMAVWDTDIADWQTPEAERPPRANWQLIDLSLEMILDLGLKPIYTTCFTPTGMTDDSTVCWPDKNSTGMPRDLSQWQDFVSEGIAHHLARFGQEEVRSWYFECWNEPNLRGCFFGGTREEFFQLWSATWHAVKRVDPSLRFGGPSTARGEWVPEFLDFTTQDGTPPDYLVVHVYNNDSDAAPLAPFDGPAAHRVKDSPHFASGVIRGIKNEIAARKYSGEVHWNEWGRSWFPMDPLKETALEAAFIVKTMAEVSQEADAFAFWCLSDIYNQCGFQSQEFQGNYGMLSLHGLRKPAWFAHQCLERLGNARIEVTGGDELSGALVTQDGERFQMIMYLYPEKTDLLSTSAQVRVQLPTDFDTLKLTRLGEAENNVIAQWRAMGAPAYPTPAQLQTLRSQNSLQAAPEGELQTDDGWAIFAMERPGVACLEGTLNNSAERSL